MWTGIVPIVQWRDITTLQQLQRHTILLVPGHMTILTTHLTGHISLPATWSMARITNGRLENYPAHHNPFLRLFYTP